MLKVHAYQRQVVGGAPGGAAPGGKRLRYFIYLETPPTAEVTVDGVWIGRAFHAVEATTRTSPVRFDSPVNTGLDERSVAVPATANKVTEIVVGEPKPGKAPGSDALEILRASRAAVQVTYRGRSLLVPVPAFQERDPLYLP